MSDVVNATLTIQRGYRRWKRKKDDLPDLDSADVAAATIKIQSAYKGFKTRQMIKKHKEVLPDLNCAQVQDATVKIQSAYRGFQTRKQMNVKKGADARDVIATTSDSSETEDDSLPDLKDAEVENATLKIQSAYRGFQTRKQMKEAKEDLPDLKAKEVVDATIKIQSAYKGFRTRKMVQKHKEIMPDLNCAQVQDATVKIQSAYRGFQTRKQMKEANEDLPDLKADDVVAATIKIQSAYKGFKTRQMVQKHKEIMPDLNCAQVQDATVKIQSAYRGFQTRKEMAKSKAEQDDDLPDLCDQETLAAALKIQSAFKGYQVRKVVGKVPLTPQPSIDFEHMSPADLNGSTSSKRVPPVPRRFDSKEKQAVEKNTSFRKSSDFGVKESQKSPLPARSSRLKEVAPPKVPPQGSKKIESSEDEGFMQQTKKSFFKKPATPITPVDEGDKITFREAAEAVKPKPVAKDADKKEQKGKIGGFFSSMFGKKEKPKEKPTTPESAIDPDMAAMAGVEFQFTERAEMGGKVPPAAEVKKDEVGQPAAGEKGKVKSKPLAKVEERKPAKESAELKESSPKSIASVSSGKPQSEVEDPDLKKDLIHTVLCAVEENWLNQAPKPHLDKVAALQAVDSDPELENSERSTSEADYVKKKMRAQKSEDILSDDEGARLCKQESADGDLPYVMTTLPQERTGTVSITPSSQRLSQCKLASTERPRSSSPRKPGQMEQFKKSQAKGEKGKDPITVKLPRQESKTNLKKTKEKGQTWDNFSAAGLPSPKPARKVQAKGVAGGRREPPQTLKTAPKSASQPKPDWIDCESLPEKKKAIKKYDSSEMKSPTEVSQREAIRSPNGTKIVSPEECSCDCHQESPPQTLTRASSLLSRVAGSSAPASSKMRHSHSQSSTSSCAPTPPKRVESKGAVPKGSSGRRTTGAPPLPIRTSSAVKSPKASLVGSGREAARAVPPGSARVKASGQNSEREVRRVTQESRNVRRREEAKREPLTKRTSTASSDD